MEINLKLQGREFSDTPTKTEIDNVLTDIQGFLSRMSGALLAKGEFTVADQPMATLLNATVQLKAAKDLFAATKSGLAIPQLPR